MKIRSKREWSDSSTAKGGRGKALGFPRGGDRAERGQEGGSPIGSFAQQSNGFGLMETIIGVAVFFLVATSSYRALLAVLNLFNATTFKITAADVANEKIEIIRNMEFADIGILGGIPVGVIPASETIVRSGDTYIASTTVRNIDDPFDGTIGGVPNDLSPADYKLVEIAVSCISCTDQVPSAITARVAPKGLETTSSNGALFIQAIDANGSGIGGATVQVVNSTTNPSINITDTTDATGFLKLVDVPPKAQSYQITVSKNGYSTDRTYATSTGNPNPLKPHATVSQGQVTQATFAVDRTSALAVSSVTNTCAPTGGIHFDIEGAKLIGTAPDVPKTTGSYTTASDGTFSVQNLEWDTYSFAFDNTNAEVEGTIPDLPISLMPNTTQAVKVVIGVKVPNTLVVSIRDSVSGLPVSGADIGLSRVGFAATSTTGRGFLRQSDWSGGSGQEDFNSVAAYFDDDGNVDTNTPAGDLKLKTIATSTYASAALLTSSTFDTGSVSNFFTLTWNPTSQPSQTGTDAIRAQIATATSSTPSLWNYRGPDGTSGSYYTISNPNIPAIHNGDRYLRYRLYLQTASTTYTPTLSDIAVTFASDCVPSGQTFFSGLSLGSYTLTIEKSGYQTASIPLTLDSSWQFITTTLIPQ